MKTLLPDAPLAVVNEGLFPYLFPAETEAVVCNIRDLLHEFSCCWITPDFSIRGEVTQVGIAARISPHRFRSNRVQHV